MPIFNQQQYFLTHPDYGESSDKDQEELFGDINKVLNVHISPFISG
jgi:hypothetical protein